MKYKLLTFQSFFILLTSLVQATEIDFPSIVKNCPHAVVVQVENNEPKIIEIIYSDNADKIPTLSIHKNVEMNGKYLVFLPDKKNVDIFTAITFYIIKGDVVIFKSAPAKDLQKTEVGSRTQTAVVSETINTTNLFKDLKIMRDAVIFIDNP